MEAAQRISSFIAVVPELKQDLLSLRVVSEQDFEIHAAHTRPNIDGFGRLRFLLGGLYNTNGCRILRNGDFCWFYKHRSWSLVTSRS